MRDLLEQVGPRDVLAVAAIVASIVALLVIAWCWPNVPRVFGGRGRRVTEILKRRFSIASRRLTRARRDSWLVIRAPYVITTRQQRLAALKAQFPAGEPHPYDWAKREPMVWTPPPL
jgi:hypothetical protein